MKIKKKQLEKMLKAKEAELNEKISEAVLKRKEEYKKIIEAELEKYDPETEAYKAIMNLREEMFGWKAIAKRHWKNIVMSIDAVSTLGLIPAMLYTKGKEDLENNRIIPETDDYIKPIKPTEDI